jgi:hypothetical protein
VTEEAKGPLSFLDWSDAIDAEDCRAARALVDGTGLWRLVLGEVCCLECPSKGFYEIDLYDCTRSSAVLDWVFQIHLKGWGSEYTIALLDALQIVLHPQSSLCSFGGDRELSVEGIDNRCQDVILRADKATP